MMPYSFYLMPTIAAALAAAAFFTQSEYLAQFFRAGQHILGAGNGGSWQVIHHLGGSGPWFQKTENLVESDIATPLGCRVDQVHLISRHAERYPTITSGIKMLELYHRIKRSNVTFDDELAFVNHWEFLTLDPNRHFEGLVSVGPYAGTLEAFSTGVKLRTRYGELLDDARKRGQTTFWASDSERVIETAKYFSLGFFGLDHHQVARLEIIPETTDRQGDTLTPGRTCLNYANDVDERGHNLGADMLFKYRAAYIPSIIERLAQRHPQFRFTESEVYSMQELCGFETLAKGSSPWCSVFKRIEMESFEYARDILHFYRSGPGNPYSATMGWLWLNATARLLENGSATGPLFLSFVHDGDIVPLLAALDVMHQEPALPTDHMLRNRTWRTSDVVPMGGRLIFERIGCPAVQNCWSNAPFYPNHVYCDPPSEDFFVRLNINDGIVELPNCTSGPGSSCPLTEFLHMVRQRGKELPEFADLCGLPKDATAGISFLHQAYDP